MLTLEHLVAPVAAADFVARYWEKRWLHVPAPRACRYENLLSISEIESLLAYNQNRLIANYALASRGPATPQLTADISSEIYAAYQRGDSLFIGDLHKRSRAVAELCRDLERSIGHALGASLVLTPPSAQGFAVHYDPADVFVLQLRGEKTWRLLPPHYPLPVLGDPIQDVESGREGKAVRLGPGDLLYVPRGVPHEATTNDSYSLHVSLYVTTVPWKALLSRALDHVARRDVRFREALPLGLLSGQGDWGQLEGRFRELMEILSSQADAFAAGESLAAQFVDSLRPLASGHFEQLSMVDSVGLDSGLRHRLGVICHVSCDDTTARIHFPGGGLSGPPGLAAAFYFIAATPSFKPLDIPFLTDQARLTLAHRLIREGLLEKVAALSA
jgi:Cupin superfamily protein